MTSPRTNSNAYGRCSATSQAWSTSRTRTRGSRDELIAYGPLLSDDGATWLGTAALLRAPDPDTARAILTPDRYADIEVHNWQFGGRPS